MTAVSSRDYVAADATDDERQLIAGARSFVADAMRVTRTPGLSIAVARNGRVMWEAALGYANLARGIAMTTDNTWPGASFAKVYVATAVLQLVEERLLDLYAPIRTYVPELDVRNPLGAREVTLYDLLTHTSGLAFSTAHPRLEPEKGLSEHLIDVFRQAHRLEYRLKLPLWTARVGARYQYSSLGIATAGYIVERTNRDALSFADFVDQRIAEPLGLKATAFRGPAAPDRFPEGLEARRCTGYMAFGSVMIPTPILYSAGSPAGGLLTTPGDQARLLLVFTKGGRANGSALLDPSTVRMMTTPQSRMDDAEAPAGAWTNGLGFEINDAGKRSMHFGHGSGQQWGWYSHCAAFPADETVVVVCTNRWDMTRYTNPPSEIAPGLTTTFIRRWLDGDEAARARASRETDWAWKASYMMGAMMVERVHAFLGAPGAIPDETISRLAAEAHVDAQDATKSWVPDAFRMGAEEMMRVEPTADAVRDFFASGRGCVTGADLPLLGLWFGRRAGLSVPHTAITGVQH